MPKILSYQAVAKTEEEKITGKAGIEQDHKNYVVSALSIGIFFHKYIISKENS